MTLQEELVIKLLANIAEQLNAIRRKVPASPGVDDALNQELAAIISKCQAAGA